MVKSLYVATSQRSAVELELPAVIEKLLPGDIILLQNRLSPLAWLIRLFTKSWWTHAEVYVGNGNVVGAHFLGVQWQPLGELIESWTLAIFLRPDASDETRTKVAQFACTHVKDGYDFWHLVLYIWRILRGTLGKAPMPDDPHKHVCFEFAAFCWHKFGVSVGGIYADNVTGKSLVEDPKLHNVFK